MERLINDHANSLQQFNNLLIDFGLIQKNDHETKEEEKMPQNNEENPKSDTQIPLPNLTEIQDTTTEMYETDFPSSSSTIFITDLPAYNDDNNQRPTSNPTF